MSASAILSQPRKPQAGVPDKPRPWLVSTARFKAINGMRRRARFDSAQKDLALYLEARITRPLPLLWTRLPLEGAAGSLWVLRTGAPWIEPLDRVQSDERNSSLT
jgi:hypothetical protein